SIFRWFSVYSKKCARTLIFISTYPPALSFEPPRVTMSPMGSGPPEAAALPTTSALWKNRWVRRSFGSCQSTS
ncbi:hypothetical protein J6590_101721, partial [Homalodisca vitripennis]